MRNPPIGNYVELGPDLRMYPNERHPNDPKLATYYQPSTGKKRCHLSASWAGWIGAGATLKQTLKNKENNPC